MLTPDVVDTPEFKMAEEKVQKDRERALRFELRREKEREDYHRRKVMARPKITFIPKGLTVDYEKEYAVFFDQEVTYNPIDSDDFLYQVRLMNRWQDKSVPQIIEMGRPDAAYAIAIELCRHIPLFLNRDDLQEYIQENKLRIKKMIVGSFSALVSSVKAWNNEEKRLYVNNFIFEQSKQYGDFRGLQKTLIQIILNVSKMYSDKDFQTFWFRYKTEGEPHGISINSFCINQGVPYKQFYAWFKKHAKDTVIPVEIEGAPTDEETDDVEVPPLPASKPKTKKSKGGILITIQTTDGLFVKKGGLDYAGMKDLVSRLEGLC